MMLLTGPTLPQKHNENRYHHVTVLLYTWFSYSARNPGIVSRRDWTRRLIGWLN